MSSNPHDGSLGPGPSGRTRRIRRFPLRTKLIGIFTVVIVAVCLAIGAITQVLLTHYLTDQLDRQVAASFVRLSGPPPNSQNSPAAANDSGPGARSRATGDHGGEVFEDWANDKGDEPLCNSRAYPNGPGGRQPDNSVFAIYAKGDGALRVSAAIRGTYPSCTVLTSAQAQVLTQVPTAGRITAVGLAGFGDYRLTARTVDGTTFVSGLSTASITATRGQLLTILALVTGSAVVIGGAAVWWSVRRSLATLEEVAETARKATSLPLHRGSVELAVRVPQHLTDPRTEAGTVGAALNQLLAHVAEALRAREQSEAKVRQFVADASHELRTPLTAIRGYAELAGRHPEDVDGVRHALARVQSESTRMSTLVEDLLLLARLDAGRPVSHDPVDLTALAVDAVSDARVAAADHRWVVSVPAGPVMVAGDAARLHQILANLLTNARVHTPAGTTVTVEVAASPHGGVLRVADDGPGIPDELHEAVFGRFVRGDTSRSRGSGSTGLGLAIVAGIVQAHGGTLTLDSSPGTTVFTVTLPAAGEYDGAAGDVPPDSHSAGTGDGR